MSTGSDDRKRAEDLIKAYCCEHATLTTILGATLGQLGEIPMEHWHPSLAAMMLSINAMRGAITAAYVHGNKNLAEKLQDLFDEIAPIIKNVDLGNNPPVTPSCDIPEVFRKAFQGE